MNRILIGILVFLLLGVLFYLGIMKQNTSSEKLTETTIPESAEYAVFAGGCFWCMEAPFEQLEGVYEVESGYTGGTVENPTYEQVASHTTGHVEAVRVWYNPEIITFNELLDTYWKQIDPTDAGGQFADRGESYTTAIFYTNEQEKEIAKKSKEEIASAGIFTEPIVTKIQPEAEFYLAEQYHQNYYKKHPTRYNFYKKGSGRTDFIEENWK